MAYSDPLDERNRAAKRRHYHANKQQYLDRNIAAKAARRVWLHEQKDVPCTDCGRRYPYYVMQFDHLDPTQKLMTVSRLVLWSWRRLKAEVAKCEVVCANCHAERTHQRRLAQL